MGMVLKINKIYNFRISKDKNNIMMNKRAFYKKQDLAKTHVIKYLILEAFIFDKVYFYSSRLSVGFASLCSIERINLKSRAD